MLVSDDYNPSQAESQILHPSSRTLFRFWEKMRGGNASPRRDELDLREIRHLVPHIFIAEFAPRTQTFKWRLAGTGVCEIYRQELTGTSMLRGWDAFETDVISRFLSSTVNELQPCLLRFRFHTDRNQILGAELAGFPMTAADGTSIHILGGLFPFREAWTLGYSALTHFELAGARSIWTEHLPSDVKLPAPSAAAPKRFHVIPGGRADS